mmetsp:Transcript_11981/g.34337  ORF Transcript_11981/g.34337 Transcript_11981/m.34337 type:complete len:141 (-) Transcript_11981:368-790(-)
MFIKEKFGQRWACPRSRQSMASEDYFDIPSKRTIFGVTKSENWKSFRNRYSDANNSKQRVHPDTKCDPDNRTEQRKNKGQGIRNLFWIFLQYILVRSKKTSRPTNRSESCGRGNDDEWLKNIIPFIERYSDYFDRRTNNL